MNGIYPLIKLTKIKLFLNSKKYTPIKLSEDYLQFKWKKKKIMKPKINHLKKNLKINNLKMS
jgi:hypothetical protein